MWFIVRNIEAMKILWDKSNEIGVAVIDRQHEHFFGIVNKIFGLISANNTTKPDLMAVISELAGYAAYHFSTEEEYFKKYGYKEAQDHIRAHDKYSQRVSELMEKRDDPRTNMDRLSEEIADFTVTWLTKHLMEKDRRYVPWLKKHES